MTATNATAKIRDHRHESFRWLRRNGIRSAASDAFEQFVRKPGTLRRPSLIVRCQRTRGDFTCRIVTHKPISEPRLQQCFLPFLRRLQDRTRGPWDFFVLVSDNVYVAPENRSKFLWFLEHVPFLRCDQRDDDESSLRAILIPDFSLQDPEYADELVEVRKAAQTIEFDARREIIKWRGRLSGPDYPTLANVETFPRYHLLLMSLQHPDRIDARLTDDANLAGCDSAVALKRRIETLFGSLVPTLHPADFVRYKYLISLDGAVAAWKRVPLILASGSVLMLQHRWRQFFYPGLQPGVHYVPLKPDASDIRERYEWLRSQPERARAVARNGQRFAQEVLNPEAVENYFVEILELCSMLHCG